tara:strand:+ start:258 stop:731 length:474 start_codon:yes stop_codon:yes gene_type:complete
MFFKFLSVFTALMLITAPIHAHASESPLPLQGKVTSISKGAKSPYSGILLDPLAASKMLVDKKFIRLEVELTLRKEFQKQLATQSLSLDLLKADYSSLKKIHEETMKLKNKRIADLDVMLKQQMSKSNNSEWWLAGGIVIGIALSIAVFYASVEISR